MPVSAKVWCLPDDCYSETIFCSYDKVELRSLKMYAKPTNLLRRNLKVEELELWLCDLRCIDEWIKSVEWLVKNTVVICSCGIFQKRWNRKWSIYLSYGTKARQLWKPSFTLLNDWNKYEKFTKYSHFLDDHSFLW